MTFDEFKELQERVEQGEEFNVYFNNEEYWISHNTHGYYLTRVKGSLTQAFDSPKSLFENGTIQGQCLSDIYRSIVW